MNKSNNGYEFSLDRLNSVSPKSAGMAVVGALSSYQHTTPEQQVAGAAVMFTLLLRRYGVHVGQALAVAENLLEKALPICPELRAARQYVESEL